MFLFGYVIIVNKPRDINININININRIYCIPSLNNITANTSIIDPACKSTYQSTNEPTCEAPAISIISCNDSHCNDRNGLKLIKINALNLPARSTHYIYIFMKDIMMVNVNLQMIEFGQSVMPDFCVLYVLMHV